MEIFHECIEKENKMLHIYSCINSNSGGWLQLGCTEGQTKKYAEFQDMEIVGEYSDEGHSGKNIIGWKMVNLSLQRMKRKGR